MKSIEINPNNLKKAYKKASTEGKALLENLFGYDQLKFEITDLVKSYEDACEILGINPDVTVKCGASEDQEAIIAFAQLSIIRAALNQDWEADWKNHNQPKYYPWFKDSGSGLSYDDFARSLTLTDVGSRLCYATPELAKYAGEQFIEIYRKFLTV
ncbi:hypothetical protein BH09BAC1_BH09BAC1_14310 [soil metagenome]